MSALTLAALLALAVVLVRGSHSSGTGSDGPDTGQGDTEVSVSRVQPRQSAPEVNVRVAADHRTVAVPRSFFGLSTEYWTLPIYERHLKDFERVLALLRVRGNGPMVLRIGGDSADHTFWDPRDAENLPRWAFELDPVWLAQTSGLVRREGLRLILDLNLVTGSPARAARWAQAAEAGLPRGSVQGFEVGNEPDIYAHWYWQAAVSRASLAPKLLPSFISAGSYTEAFRAYARALSHAVPGVPLLGPALANPRLNANWVADLIRAERPAMGMITAHRYPFSACVHRASRAYPTAARILGTRGSEGVARSLQLAVSLAHRAGLPFRLTELNSVTCGGLRGVSNTFATALWAPDALFEVLRAGVDGVNLHIRDATINAPFRMIQGGIWARPLLYGLILFARTLGPDARLLHLDVHSKPSLHVKVWAVRLRGDVLHALVINKGDHSATVDLHVRGSGNATVQRLLAPSVKSDSGVTLGGRRLGSNARWRGPTIAQTVAPGGNGYLLTVPRFSAALLSLHLSSPLRSA